MRSLPLCTLLALTACTGAPEQPITLRPLPVAELQLPADARYLPGDGGSHRLDPQHLHAGVRIQVGGKDVALATYGPSGDSNLQVEGHGDQYLVTWQAGSVGFHGLVLRLNEVGGLEFTNGFEDRPLLAGFYLLAEDGDAYGRRPFHEDERTFYPCALNQRSDNGTMIDIPAQPTRPTAESILSRAQSK